MVNNGGYILALDVGEKRIGVALASKIARLATPLVTLENTETIWTDITQLIAKENVSDVVVGLPRSLNGTDSAQTVYVRKFAQQLEKILKIKVKLQDEALTSHKAEAELRARGTQYAKGDIDALAATYILEDYLVTIDGMEKHI